jgi:hypothetical protein
MSALDLIAKGRVAAEAIMLDTCTIRRRTGETTDLDTGEVTPVYTTILTGQKCKVQTRGAWGEPRDIGEAAKVILAFEIHLPVSVTGLNTRDEITIDTATSDPELVGRTFRIKDLAYKSLATARRFLCQEVTG